MIEKLCLFILCALSGKMLAHDSIKDQQQTPRLARVYLAGATLTGTALSGFFAGVLPGTAKKNNAIGLCTAEALLLLANGGELTINSQAAAHNQQFPDEPRIPDDRLLKDCAALQALGLASYYAGHVTGLSAHYGIRMGIGGANKITNGIAYAYRIAREKIAPPKKRSWGNTLLQKFGLTK